MLKGIRWAGRHSQIPAPRERALGWTVILRLTGWGAPPVSRQSDSQTDNNQLTVTFLDLFSLTLQQTVSLFFCSISVIRLCCCCRFHTDVMEFYITVLLLYAFFSGKRGVYCWVASSVDQRSSIFSHLNMILQNLLQIASKVHRINAVKVFASDPKMGKLKHESRFKNSIE